MTHTIEEGIKVVIVDFAEFEKVLAECGASLYFKVDNDVSQRCLEEYRHAWVLTGSGGKIRVAGGSKTPLSPSLNTTSTLRTWRDGEKSQRCRGKRANTTGKVSEGRFF